MYASTESEKFLENTVNVYIMSEIAELYLEISLILYVT